MSSLRTIAACDRSVHNEMRGKSIAGLCYDLGQALAVGGKVRTTDHVFDARDHPFEDMCIGSVDMASCERLSQIAQDARREMGEERWAELNKEWEA